MPLSQNKQTNKQTDAKYISICDTSTFAQSPQVSPSHTEAQACQLAEFLQTSLVTLDNLMLTGLLPVNPEQMR